MSFNSLSGTGSRMSPPQTILQNIRINNNDRIIFGHLNINSIRNKIDMLAEIVSGRVDVLLISETKIDDSFPNAQFNICGFSKPYRLDRNCNGGGLILYVRNDITTRKLPLISPGIECLLTEITISKRKWLLIGFYNPQKSTIALNIGILERNLSHYLTKYENVIILGDFNSEVQEEVIKTF